MKAQVYDSQTQVVDLRGSLTFRVHVSRLLDNKSYEVLLDPDDGIEFGVKDARGNWWGPLATEVPNANKLPVGMAAVVTAAAALYCVPEANHYNGSAYNKAIEDMVISLMGGADSMRGAVRTLLKEMKPS